MFRVGLENNTEGRSLAWVLGHPGCYAFGADGPTALQAVPGAIRAYRRWISEHTALSWLVGDEDGFVLEETFECYTINDDFELDQQGYEVNAWFRHDWKPLTSDDIQRGHAGSMQGSQPEVKPRGQRAAAEHSRSRGWLGRPVSLERSGCSSR